MDNFKRIADFLYEVGTMRKLPRMHRQTLHTDDNADNIASHTYRVAIIGWMLAKLENADPYKVVMMCLLHDMGEIRTGDHNWIHKRYVKIFEDEVLEDQLGSLPFSDLKDLAKEYHVRESVESIVAKDADLLDQILLLREYQMQGNQEASVWLYGKGGVKGNQQLNKLKLGSSKELGKAMYIQEPSAWWNKLWTDQNR